MMNELIKVTVENDQQLVSARDLYKGLEIKKRFSVWKNQNFKDFEEGTDFMGVPGGTPITNGNGRVQYLDDYAITLDMAKQLCMMSHTELGKTYRKYFIELERKWNDPQEIVKRGYAILQNENARLRIENQEMKPKAVVADAITSSETSVSISVLAKILKKNGIEVGRNRLFAFLRDKNYLIKFGDDYNLPTQYSMELGLMEVNEKPFINKEGMQDISRSAKVTGKGQQYFINKFLKEN